MNKPPIKHTRLEHLPRQLLLNQPKYTALRQWRFTQRELVRRLHQRRRIRSRRRRLGGRDGNGEVDDTQLEELGGREAVAFDGCFANCAGWEFVVEDGGHGGGEGCSEVDLSSIDAVSIELEGRLKEEGTGKRGGTHLVHTTPSFTGSHDAVIARQGHKVASGEGMSVQGRDDWD